MKQMLNKVKEGNKYSSRTIKEGKNQWGLSEIKELEVPHFAWAPKIASFPMPVLRNPYEL